VTSLYKKEVGEIPEIKGESMSVDYFPDYPQQIAESLKVHY